MKKALTATVLFQLLCLVSMAVGHFGANATITGMAFYGDIIGAVMCPIILAITAMIVGLRDEKRVVKMFPDSAGATGIIGLIRGILFFAASGKDGFVLAMKYLLISFLLLTLWFLIFDVTANILTKGTKYTRNKKIKK